MPTGSGDERRAPARLGDESGFSLPELLVVVLVIGVLAAIALPVFLGQKKGGHDSSTKSDVRNLVTAVETCFQAEEDYRGCDSPEELDDGGGAPYGSGPGKVRVTRATKSTYVITGVSKATSGGANHVFEWARVPGKITRTCKGSGGCRDGVW